MLAARPPLAPLPAIAAWQAARQRQTSGIGGKASLDEVVFFECVVDSVCSAASPLSPTLSHADLTAGSAPSVGWIRGPKPGKAIGSPIPDHRIHPPPFFPFPQNWGDAKLARAEQVGASRGGIQRQMQHTSAVWIPAFAGMTVIDFFHNLPPLFPTPFLHPKRETRQS